MTPATERTASGRQPSGRCVHVCAAAALLALSAGWLSGCRDGKAGGPDARPAVVDERDPFAERRSAMVSGQIRARGVTDERVLAAMGSVPREEFVPDSQRPFAYEDRPLPIGEGQTISQPYIVALMTELLEVEPDDRVLEIGTGSGYQAAILAELTYHVYTIEILETLGLRAEQTLARLGYDQVHVMIGDGYRGWPEHAPFDAIIVTCAPEAVPEPLVDQLADGGRMVIPVGPQWTNQTLYVMEKEAGGLRSTGVIPVRFVPMVRE